MGIATNWRTHLTPMLGGQDCQLCGVTGESIICHDCVESLPQVSTPQCPQCGLHGEVTGICGACLKTPPYFDLTVSAFAYEFPLDRLLQAFKFRQQIVLAGFFAQQLAKKIGSAQEREKRALPDQVIAVPLSRQRLADRGFNQAALVAEQVARRLGLPFLVSTLKRRRDTPAQSGLGIERRKANIRGAFESAPLPPGSTIALVDDVMTTGATLSEAARELKNKGAARVDVWVVARAERMDHR